MGSKTRLSSYCTKRANNGVNLVTSRKINTRLARPITRNPSKSCEKPHCVEIHPIEIWGSHMHCLQFLAILFDYL